MSNSRLSFEKLFKELCIAEEKEARYWRENDAKFRAVHQKVATYDEFRGIVQASHLKPLDKNDKINGKFYQPWNAISSEKSYTEENHYPVSSSNLHINDPDNKKNFFRLWKLSTSVEKYCFLTTSRKEHIKTIFSVDINCELLGEAVVELNNNYNNIDASKIFEVLSIFADASRFKLLLDFLSQPEKDSLKELFKKLETDLNSKNIFDLKNVYSI
ncbi:hypothetical protein HELRODRAFT_67273 [Helobdella robusta]|uniref:Dynein attachment factor N-terminal domain-containing protein n=1 Tax=Helobdella robusta TaxID=6412 RepID=T1FYZ2_HELRO|nr:hypothetical protein HELRODRAFT_67273 [Helobdella robusta]ESN98871.1 hypothetical protein HELRODRAFT_67273 [Helobdella robusta]